MTHATDAPGVDEAEIGRHHLGSGPVIERGTTMHPLITELLIEAAEAEEIPYTIAATARGDRHRRRRDLHLRAPASRRASCRCRCATCTHRSRWSSSRTSHNTARLIAAFAQRLPADIAFER